MTTFLHIFSHVSYPSHLKPNRSRGKKGCSLTHCPAPQTANLKCLFAFLKVRRWPGLNVVTGHFHSSYGTAKTPSCPWWTTCGSRWMKVKEQAGIISHPPERSWWKSTGLRLPTALAVPTERAAELSNNDSRVSAAQRELKAKLWANRVPPPVPRCPITYHEWREDPSNQGSLQLAASSN